MIAARERVQLIVQDAKEESRARSLLKRAGANLEQLTLPLADGSGMDAGFGPDICA